MNVIRYSESILPNGTEAMLDYFALFLLFFVAVILFYGVIAIHDIPYDIARHRNHPHQDAIHVAGWVSLLTLHVIWPFLWIWATLYRPERGWGFSGSVDDTDAPEVQTQLDAMAQRIASLEETLRDRKRDD